MAGEVINSQNKITKQDKVMNCPLESVKTSYMPMWVQTSKMQNIFLCKEYHSTLYNVHVLCGSQLLKMKTSLTARNSHNTLYSLTLDWGDHHHILLQNKTQILRTPAIEWSKHAFNLIQGLVWNSWMTRILNGRRRTKLN